MYLQGVPTVVLVALLGAALSVPLQNPWNSLKFQDSNEDKSMEDYVHGSRSQYGSPSTSSSRYLLQSMEDDSREYGRQGYSSYGNSPRSSQYSPPRSMRGNNRDFGRYSSSSYNLPSQRQQRPGHRYYDDDNDDSDETYDLGYQHLYRQLQSGSGYPSRRRDTNALYTVY